MENDRGFSKKIAGGDKRGGASQQKCDVTANDPESDGRRHEESLQKPKHSSLVGDAAAASPPETNQSTANCRASSVLAPPPSGYVMPQSSISPVAAAAGPAVLPLSNQQPDAIPAEMTNASLNRMLAATCPDSCHLTARDLPDEIECIVTHIASVGNCFWAIIASHPFVSVALVIRSISLVH